MADDTRLRPSHHSSKWYKNHPQVQHPSSVPIPSGDSKDSPSRVVWFLRLIGVATVFGGFAVIPFFFWTGTIIIWIGFSECIVEGCRDPTLTNGPLWRQVCFLGVMFLLYDIFTIAVVFPSSPMILKSFAMLEGNYPDGVTIAGIEWNSHFTDLRVIVDNPSANDYHNVDLFVYPDTLVNKASMVQQSPGCEITLLSEGGLTVATVNNPKDGTGLKVRQDPIGEGTVEYHDNHGSTYESLAGTGVRLRCETLPSRFSARLVIAAVAPSPWQPSPHKQGDWVGSLYGYNGPPKPNLEMLGPRPYPKLVKIKGAYSGGLKPFSISQTIRVERGD